MLPMKAGIAAVAVNLLFNYILIYGKLGAPALDVSGVFIWCVSVVIAFVLSRYTALPVIAVYAMVQLGDIIKCVIGFILVKKGVWLQNIVA